MDLFTWSATDMSGINSEVIPHHLRMDPTCWPVKQKKRSFIPVKPKEFQAGDRVMRQAEVSQPTEQALEGGLSPN